MNRIKFSPKKTMANKELETYFDSAIQDIDQFIQSNDLRAPYVFRSPSDFSSNSQPQSSQNNSKQLSTAADLPGFQESSVDMESTFPSSGVNHHKKVEEMLLHLPPLSRILLWKALALENIPHLESAEQGKEAPLEERYYMAVWENRLLHQQLVEIRRTITEEKERCQQLEKQKDAGFTLEERLRLLHNINTQRQRLNEEQLENKSLALALNHQKEEIHQLKLLVAAQQQKIEALENAIERQTLRSSSTAPGVLTSTVRSLMFDNEEATVSESKVKPSGIVMHAPASSNEIVAPTAMMSCSMTTTVITVTEEECETESEQDDDSKYHTSINPPGRPKTRFWTTMTPPLSRSCHSSSFPRKSISQQANSTLRASYDADQLLNSSSHPTGDTDTRTTTSSIDSLVGSRPQSIVTRRTQTLDSFRRGKRFLSSMFSGPESMASSSARGAPVSRLSLFSPHSQSQHSTEMTEPQTATTQTLTRAFSRRGRQQAPPRPVRPLSGYNHDAILLPTLKEFQLMSTDHVCSWLYDLQLDMYVPNMRIWGVTGEELLVASTSQIQKNMDIRNALHLKKILVHFHRMRQSEDENVENSVKIWPYFSIRRFLDDLGLTQYYATFVESAVDAYVLDELTLEELRNNLKVHSPLHIASLRRGIQIMRHVHYDLSQIIHRDSTCPEEYGASSLPSGTDPRTLEQHLARVALWSNHRVMDWLRDIQLPEVANHVHGSGVHGALMILEPQFTDAVLSDVLNIHKDRTLLRRHICTEFERLLGPGLIQQKTSVSAGDTKNPLLKESRPQALKRALFSSSSLRRSKSGFTSTMSRRSSHSELVCSKNADLASPLDLRKLLPSSSTLTGAEPQSSVLCNSS